MKAAILRSVGSPLSIEDVAISKPGPREVLIRTAATGVCHSDLHFYEGSYPTRLPTILGHESAGVVEAVGSEVRSVQPGDHVVTCLSAFCGHCDHCVSGHISRCVSPETQRAKTDEPRLGDSAAPMTQFLHLSAFAEQMLIHENACVRIRPDMPLDRAALLGCAVITGYGAITYTAQVRPGETVAVIGCGGIGLCAINAAALAGAGRIEMTRGGVDHAIEAIGLAKTAEDAFTMLRRGGTATIVGMIPVGQKVSLNGYEFLAEKSLKGSNMGSNRFPVDIPRLVDFYMAGRLRLDELISRRIGLHQIVEASAEMKGGNIARSVITFA